VRGGGWNNNPQNARWANRNRNNPGNRNNNTGFRLARTLLAQAPCFTEHGVGQKRVLGHGYERSARRLP
jgi:hypothetical protein